MPDLDTLDPHPGNPHTHARQEAGHDRHKPWHRSLHRSWTFWVAIALMLLAIAVYIGSFDFSLRPNHGPPRQLVP